MNWSSCLSTIVVVVGSLIFRDAGAVSEYQFLSGGSSTFKNPSVQGAENYGLAFVAPSSYGYGELGVRSVLFQRPLTSIGGELGPGKYAFPVFNHNGGYGGYGGLGYYGHNLGFANPSYGIGNGIFGERIYANQII